METQNNTNISRPPPPPQNSNSTAQSIPPPPPEPPKVVEEKPQLPPIFYYNLNDPKVEKRWLNPKEDITDYFNYGLDEHTWKIYSSKVRTMNEAKGKEILHSDNQDCFQLNCKLPLEFGGFGKLHFKEIEDIGLFKIMQNNKNQFYLQHLAEPESLDMQIYNSVYQAELADKNQETILNCYKTISSDVFSENHNLSSLPDSFSNHNDANSNFFSQNQHSNYPDNGINLNSNFRNFSQSAFGQSRVPTNPMALAINRQRAGYSSWNKPGPPDAPVPGAFGEEKAFTGVPYDGGKKLGFIPQPPAPITRRMVPPAPPKPNTGPGVSNNVPNYNLKAPILERIIRPPPPSGGKPTSTKTNFSATESNNSKKQENENSNSSSKVKESKEKSSKTRNKTDKQSSKYQKESRSVSAEKISKDEDSSKNRSDGNTENSNSTGQKNTTPMRKHMKTLKVSNTFAKVVQTHIVDQANQDKLKRKNKERALKKLEGKQDDGPESEDRSQDKQSEERTSLGSKDGNNDKKEGGKDHKSRRTSSKDKKSKRKQSSENRSKHDQTEEKDLKESVSKSKYSGRGDNTPAQEESSTSVRKNLVKRQKIKNSRTPSESIEPPKRKRLRRDRKRRSDSKDHHERSEDHKRKRRKKDRGKRGYKESKDQDIKDGSREKSKHLKDKYKDKNKDRRHRSKDRYDKYGNRSSVSPSMNESRHSKYSRNSKKSSNTHNIQKRRSDRDRDRNDRGDRDRSDKGFKARGNGDKKGSRDIRQRIQVKNKGRKRNGRDNEGRTNERDGGSSKPKTSTGQTNWASRFINNFLKTNN